MPALIPNIRDPRFNPYPDPKGVHPCPTAAFANPPRDKSREHLGTPGKALWEERPPMFSKKPILSPREKS